MATKSKKQAKPAAKKTAKELSTGAFIKSQILAGVKDNEKIFEQAKKRPQARGQKVKLSHVAWYRWAMKSGRIAKHV